MRIEDLRYLIRVAEVGSIRQAAEVCYITQQGLSRIISSLEKELGVPLFQRSSNRILLTDTGKIVVARAKELDALYQQMLLDVSRDSRTAEGLPPVDYHIYTTPLISSTVLPRVLAALNLRHPGLNLNIVELTPPEITDKVDFTGNCVGIVSIPDFHQAQSLRLASGELCFDRYFSDELMLGVAEQSPLAQREFISAAELATIPMALCHTEALMFRDLLPPGTEPTVALHISSYELCRDMVSRNRAAGFTSVLRDHYSKCRVKAIPVEKKVMVSYGCIYDPSAARSPFLDHLCSMVRAELSPLTKQVGQTQSETGCQP